LQPTVRDNPYVSEDPENFKSVLKHKLKTNRKFRIL